MITLGRIKEFHKALENATVIPQEYEEFLQEIDGTIAECESNPEQAKENELKSYYAFREIFHIIFYACWPLAKIEEAIKFLVEPNIKDCESFKAPQYSTDILFDKFNNLPEFQKEVVVRSIAGGDAFCYDALLQIIKGGSKDEFVAFIHNNRCRTDNASALCWYYNSFDALELKNEMESAGEDTATAITLVNIYSANIGDSFGGKCKEAMDEFTDMFSSFMQIVDNFENEGFVRLTDTIDAFKNNELLSYLEFLYRDVIENLSDEPIVSQIIVRIKSRPEVAEYFKVWDEECQNKQVEAVVSSDEERSAQHFEEALQGTQPSLKDAILSHLSNDDKETDKSLMIGDLSFYVNEKDKLADLFSGLVDIDVVPREDCQYVVYRFTGKWKPNELPECIKWKSDLNDLLYLVKKLIDGNGKYGRALQLFEIDGIPPKQPAAYAERPSIKLRKLFESIFGKS